MALVLADRVRDTTTTTGTGTVTLSGTAPTGYQNFSVIGNSNTTYYTINAGSQWEVGIGTYSSTGPTLARTTVLASSNGGSLVDFSTGTKDVFVTYPAERSVAEGYGLLPVANGGTGATTLTSGYLVKGNGTSAVSASVVYDNGTNVGIGTASPGSRLDVVAQDAIRATGFQPFLTLRDSSDANKGSRIQTASATTIFYNDTTGGGTYTERMRIDSSGNVGIGTSAPSSRLTITGGITEIRDGNYLMLRPSGNAWDMRLQATGTQLDILSGGSLGSPIMSLLNGGNVGIGTSSPGKKLDLVGQFRVSGSAASGYALLEYGTSATATNNWHVGSEGDGSFRWYNGTLGAGTERMRITSGGNVGIGASAPTTNLQIGDISAADATFQGRIKLEDTSGSLQSVGGLEFATSSFGAGYGWKINSIDSSGVHLVFGTRQNSANWSEMMRIDSSGNVGIGTSSPAAKLDVVGIASARSDISTGNSPLVAVNTNIGNNTTKYTSLLLQGYDTVGTGKNVGLVLSGPSDANYVTSYMAFHTRSGDALAERMRITSGGFLLVGTTAPLGGNTSSEFKVTGAGSWPLTLNANDRGLLVRNSAAGSGFYAYFEYNGGTNNGSISWSGGTTSYTTTSDARIKKNIVDAPDAGALIDAIKVRSWDFKADDVHWRYGMVAQELLPVAPEAVTVPEDEEMMMGVDYAKLVPMLIKEVQSLRARVAQLEGK